MSNRLPWLAVLLAVGLAPDCPAQPGVGTGPDVRAHRERSTWLFVQTQPPGAAVELDGDRLGRSDELFPAPPGVHTLTVSLDGYRTEHRTIEVPEKRITRLVLGLQRSPGRRYAAARTPGMPVGPLLVHSRPRYNVVKLAWGNVPPAEEPPALRVLTGHVGQVNCVEFSPNGRLLASAGADGTIRLWSIPRGSPLHVLTVEGSQFGVYSVAFSPDGRTLASCSGNVVRLWDPDRGRLMLANGEVGRAQSLDFSADGETVIVATGPDSLALCDTDSLQVQSVQGIKLPTEVALLGHDDSVRRITYSRDERLLAIAGGWHPQAPGRITIRETSSSRLLSSFEVSDGCVRGVAFSPDNRLIAYAAGSRVKLVEMAALPGRPGAR